MALFKVTVHGTGIQIPEASGHGNLVGFYRVQKVRAASPKAAEDKVLWAVQHDWTSGRRASHGAKPSLEVDRVVNVSLLQYLTHRNGGHIFYSEES